MTWNIWHGGLHGTKADGFKKDTANTINVFNVLLKEKADILLMQETYCCGMEIAKMPDTPIQYKQVPICPSTVNTQSLIQLEIFKPFNAHGAVIDIDGQRLLFVNIWLHYLPDSFEDIKKLNPDSLIANEVPTRLKEITSIMKVVDSLEKKLKIPVIIGGF